MYNMVEGSRGVAPRFAITIGLQEGYGTDAKVHTADEVTEIVLNHLKEYATLSRPFLTGSVTTGTVVYAWRGENGEGLGGHEPQATYSGNVNPLYNSGMNDKVVEKFLNGLASRLGAELGQTRVYVEYGIELWILQREDSETPTGESV